MQESVTATFAYNQAAIADGIGSRGLIEYAEIAEGSTLDYIAVNGPGARLVASDESTLALIRRWPRWPRVSDQYGRLPW